MFSRAGGGWTLAHTWPAPVPAREGRFGASVSLSADGSVAVVGEQSSLTPGRFHVYRRGAGGAWRLQQSVAPVYPRPGALFGVQAKLSADGSTLVVGSSLEDSGSTTAPSNTSLINAGAAFVYAYDKASAAWRMRAYLKAPTPTAHDWFGSSTAISGDGATVVVGERFRDVSGWPSAGAAYVFRRNGTQYTLAQTLSSPQPQTNAHFGGHALALTPDGTQLAIGEIGDSSTGTGADADPTPRGRTWAGATHLYRWDGAGFAYARYVKATNTGQADMFGWALALTDDGGTLAVGAPGEGSDSTGFGGDQADNNVLHRGAVYLY